MDIEKEKKAIARLQAFAPDPSDPYYVCYSGGKDSDCLRILCELSDVPHELHHNYTTVDAPETVYYIRSIPGVHVHYPGTSMWRLIVKNKIPPFRTRRYCCDVLKEGGGRGRLKVTGVRAAKSVMRAQNAGLLRLSVNLNTFKRLPMVRITILHRKAALFIILIILMLFVWFRTVKRLLLQ